MTENLYCNIYHIYIYSKFRRLNGCNNNNVLLKKVLLFFCKKTSIFCLFFIRFHTMIFNKFSLLSSPAGSAFFLLIFWTLWLDSDCCVCKLTHFSCHESCDFVVRQDVFLLPTLLLQTRSKPSHLHYYISSMRVYMLQHKPRGLKLCLH